MKIDKSRPSHWWSLACFGLQAVLALVLRRFGLVRRRGAREVVLYGHKLNGNLLALYQRMEAEANTLVPVFVTMDAAYGQQLRAQGVYCQLATRPGCARLLARAVAVISDHGLHAMQPLLGRSGLRFFDVWHGIPFKGFDPDDFRVQHRYDEVWVSSPALRTMYIERFGFDPARVVATGYGRTDALVHRSAVLERQARHSLGIEGFSRSVLFAPTWRQDDASRDIYPFGQSEDVFLDALADVCERHGAVLLVRKHLNTSGGVGGCQTRANVRLIPSSIFPETESIVAVSDVLILDWSSIAFDFLLLDRPTIFLDVSPPFAKGFSLGPEYRFGDVVGNMQALLLALDTHLVDPKAYLAEHGEQHRRVKEVAYGGFADGRAAERYLKRLIHHLISDGSSR